MTDIVKQNALDDTRAFLYDLLRMFSSRGQDGNLYIAAQPIKRALMLEQRQHIKDNFDEIWNDMVSKGFITATNILTESGYDEVNGLNRARTKDTINASGVNISVSGNGSRVNFGSVDNSVTNIINHNQLEIFDKMEEIAAQVPASKEVIQNIQNSIEEMKMAISANDRPRFIDKYNNFMQSAAAHMTFFAPIISEITKLF